MNYYHLRFNVYEQSGVPVEKEMWIRFDDPLDDSRIREYLEVKHKNKVSMIVSKEICLEEFQQTHSAIS
jgi:hypothetical protein